jgi:hypothetical protein
MPLALILSRAHRPLLSSRLQHEFTRGTRLDDRLRRPLAGER